MPLLTVTGVPVAPAGKTLQSATLAVRFLETYADGVYSYPRLHEAVLSEDGSRWETEAGEAFVLPGSSLYSYLATPCVLVEKHSYTDGGAQFFERGPLRIVETSPGEWHYATPEPDALVTSLPDAPPPQALLQSQLGAPGGVAQLDQDGELVGLLTKLSTKSALMYGSNSNGSYVRYPTSGLQMCWGSGQMTHSFTFVDANQTLPASFPGEYAVSIEVGGTRDIDPGEISLNRTITYANSYFRVLLQGSADFTFFAIGLYK